MCFVMAPCPEGRQRGPAGVPRPGLAAGSPRTRSGPGTHCGQPCRRPRPGPPRRGGGSGRRAHGPGPACPSASAGPRGPWPAPREQQSGGQPRDGPDPSGHTPRDRTRRPRRSRSPRSDLAPESACGEGQRDRDGGDDDQLPHEVPAREGRVSGIPYEFHQVAGILWARSGLRQHSRRLGRRLDPQVVRQVRFRRPRGVPGDSPTRAR
jgi:hypothetical protein